MITTPEIICDVFSFLDKDQIERIQLVNQFWNNVIIIHKNILPLRQLVHLDFTFNQISFDTTKEELARDLNTLFPNRSYTINFNGTNLSKGHVSSRYSQLTVDEVLNNLNDVVFDEIKISFGRGRREEYLLNFMKRVAKNGGRFRGRFGRYSDGRFGSKLTEIFGQEFLNNARYKIHPN